MDKEEFRVYQNQRRQEAIVKLGGECVDCGSVDKLEFDHVDPSTKEFVMADMWTRKQSLIDSELVKCVLRCDLCHINKTNNVDGLSIEHGGGLSGKKNCPCEPCKDRKSEYMSVYNGNRMR